MFNVIKTSRWDMKFLTGVLNSRLVTFWLRRKGKMQGGNYQVDKEPLLNIPLPPPEDCNQKPIIDLVDEILVAKKRNPVANTEELERKIDKLVYELYGITDEKEIAVIEGMFDKHGNETVPKGKNLKARSPKDGVSKNKRKPIIEEEF